MDAFGPPHNMFCECCEFWRKKEEESKSAEKGQGEQEESDKDFHESQADGFSNGD